MQIRLLLSVLSASKQFDKVGLLAFKTFSKQQKHTIFVEISQSVLLSDPETQKLFLALVYLILKVLITT